MSHALQVSFRRLLPSEKLVSLANESFQHIHRHRPELEECCVVVEALGDSRARRVQATVSLRGGDGELLEGSAVHAEAEVALSLALAQLQTRVGVFPAPRVSRLVLSRPAWSPRRVAAR
jgi:hypothetical protein